MVEDEMVGWHHQLNGHEFEQTLGDGEGQGNLACCCHGVTKSQRWLSDWTELNWISFWWIHLCILSISCDYQNVSKWNKPSSKICSKRIWNYHNFLFCAKAFILSQLQKLNYLWNQDKGSCLNKQQLPSNCTLLFCFIPPASNIIAQKHSLLGWGNGWTSENYKKQSGET